MAARKRRIPYSRRSRNSRAPVRTVHLVGGKPIVTLTQRKPRKRRQPKRRNQTGRKSVIAGVPRPGPVPSMPGTSSRVKLVAAIPVFGKATDTVASTALNPSLFPRFNLHGAAFRQYRLESMTATYVSTCSMARDGVVGIMVEPQDTLGGDEWRETLATWKSSVGSGLPYAATTITPSTPRSVPLRFPFMATSAAAQPAELERDTNGVILPITHFGRAKGGEDPMLRVITGRVLTAATEIPLGDVLIEIVVLFTAPYVPVPPPAEIGRTLILPTVPGEPDAPGEQ